MDTRFKANLKQSTIVFSSILVGCTSVTVTPLDSNHKVQKICIRENPKVTVPEFIPVVRDGLNRHEIDSEFIPFNPQNPAVPIESEESNYDRHYMYITTVPDDCDFSLAYTARRSWDLGTYLSMADIEISDKSSIIASANYHLIGKGGFSLLKWQGVKTKIDPVMDELLKQYPWNNFQNIEQKYTSPETELNSSQTEEAQRYAPTTSTETSSIPLEEAEQQLNSSLSVKVQEKTQPLITEQSPIASSIKPKIEPVKVIQDKASVFPEQPTETTKTSVSTNADGPNMTKCIEGWKQSAWYSINQRSLTEESTDTVREKRREELEQKIILACKNNAMQP